MSRFMTDAMWAAHQKMFGRNVSKPAAEQKQLAIGRSVNLTLPMPPTVNQLYGVASNGSKYLLDEQKKFRNDVIGIAGIALKDALPLSGRLTVCIRLHFANKRRADISNRIKAVEDALTIARVYHDDSQIDHLRIERVIDPDSPEFCAVEVKEIA